MIYRLLNFIAPDPCYFCGKVDSAVCLNCKNNIIFQKRVDCLICGFTEKDYSSQINFKKICSCQEEQFLIFTYDFSPDLIQIIHQYKFNLKRSLADLISWHMVEFWPEITSCLNESELSVSENVISALPTSSSHVRQRGFDHSQLLAKKLTQNLEVSYPEAVFKQASVLRRRHNLRQVGADAKTRKSQADSAYQMSLVGERMIKNPKDSPSLILIDDVVTTGSSMRAAWKILKKSGAKKIVGIGFVRD